MSVKIVPRKRLPADPNEVNIALLASTREISPKLVSIVEDRLRAYDKKYEEEIQRIRGITNTDKMIYCAKVHDLYTSLLQVIVKVQNERGDKKLSYEITGEYDDAKQSRSLDYWTKCNPAKADAIKCMMTELRVHGWEPKLILPDDVNIIDPETDEHIEPGKVIFTCDFTE